MNEKTTATKDDLNNYLVSLGLNESGVSNAYKWIQGNYTPNSELERIKVEAQIEAFEDAITICSSNGLDSKYPLVQDLQENIISHRQLNK